MRSLAPIQIEAFNNNGFVRIDEAFSRELAATCRDILWRDSRCDPWDRTTWREPIIRLGDHREPPFVQAANSPVLHRAFDQLLGEGRWLPRTSLGTFPIRFPHADEPDDTGWHVDASFGEPEAAFLDWRVNARSKGRALLMLFLFSDVGDTDAPTRLRIGSHHDIAQRLAHCGERGLSIRELADNGFVESSHRLEDAATGRAGTVYLCHPLLVHAAQAHHGTEPRFMAQPPLYPSERF